MTCNKKFKLLNPNAVYPRSCDECGLGPCKYYPDKKNNDIYADIDYSKHPTSLTQTRYDKKPNWGILKPRDQLIEILRRIDSGEAKPENMIIAFNELDENGKRCTTYMTGACKDQADMWQLMFRLNYIVQADI